MSAETEMDTKGEQSLGEQIESLKDAILEMKENACSTACPFIDSDFAEAHKRHHEMIDGIIKFFDDAASEVRKSIIRSIPKVLLAILWMIIVGIAVTVYMMRFPRP